MYQAQIFATIEALRGQSSEEELNRESSRHVSRSTSWRGITLSLVFLSLASLADPKDGYMSQNEQSDKGELQKIGEYTVATPIQGSLEITKGTTTFTFDASMVWDL